MQPDERLCVRPLIGRPRIPGSVEGWHKGSVGPAYPLLTRFLWECLTNRTVTGFQPRHIARSMRISRTTRSCTPHVKIFMRLI